MILAAAVLNACGGHPVRQINVLHEAHNAMSQDALTVNMGALGPSRQWGSASIGDGKRGACTPPAVNAWRTLHPVVGGKSKSHADGIDIGVIKQGRYSIVVQDARSHRPVSCGNFQI